VLDEETIHKAVRACAAGLSGYPKTKIFYASKAFMCQAICKLVESLGMCLDVVSEGELFTALSAGFPAEKIYFHGNNKSARELESAIDTKQVTMVVDNLSELNLIFSIASGRGIRTKLLLRIIPGVEADTHSYIKTGQYDSKFGFALKELDEAVRFIQKHSDYLEFKGVHAHIGSQTHKIESYLEIVDVLSDCAVEIKDKHQLDTSIVDVGGGLGIAYTTEDQPLAIDYWAESIAKRTQTAFVQRGLPLPELALEPGRCIVGTAGITLYRAGHAKSMPSGAKCLAVDGGMADNPRPITYQARYSAVIANRVESELLPTAITLVGRYCESGDIIIKEAYLPAETGDIIAVFGTGAYNYSMSSNYNRTGRPACILVKDGKADVIIERETVEDLIKQDRIPQRLKNI
jgi:diaminopimelate decarboxylase